MNKINFKQPKYIFPAILYVLLLITGWLFIDMFTTEIKTVDPRLMATEYLNSELPEARVDERLGSKRENMVNAFGDVKDYTAVANAERDSAKGKEEYETRYNAKEAATIQHNNELEQLRQLQKRAQSASAPKMGNDDFVVPLTDAVVSGDVKAEAKLMIYLHRHVPMARAIAIIPLTRRMTGQQRQ